MGNAFVLVLLLLIFFTMLGSLIYVLVVKEKEKYGEDRYMYNGCVSGDNTFGGITKGDASEGGISKNDIGKMCLWTDQYLQNNCRCGGPLSCFYQPPLFLDVSNGNKVNQLNYPWIPKKGCC